MPQPDTQQIANAADAELKTLEKIVKAFASLDDTARRRVLGYVLNRFGEVSGEP